MSEHPLSEAAQAVADSKIPPGDEYEEIREQVREMRMRCEKIGRWYDGWVVTENETDD
jgi:hypothetical protein